MTQEEKYKEALLEARAVLEPCLKYSNGKVREALDSIDKELKSFESENERIRKELIEYHKQQFEKNRDQKVGLFHKDAIAWLEKQKEQKPAECIEDSVKFEEGFKAGRESGLRDGQKYVLNNLDSYGLCKPAEWSEEDEQLLGFIYDLLADSLWNSRYAMSRDECLDRLTSLRQRLQPRPSWKPSEEQMEALHTAMYLEEMQFYGGLKDKLRDLYVQLKKLM